MLKAFMEITKKAQGERDDIRRTELEENVAELQYKNQVLEQQMIIMRESYE